MGLGSFFGKLVGSGVNELATGVMDGIDRFIETPDEKRAADIIRKKIAMEPDKWQIEINKIEAQHRTLFVAGWRPAIGWICASSLAWGWIVGPTLQFFFPGRTMPEINTAEAISLVMALLGMSAIRAYEKKVGVS